MRMTGSSRRGWLVMTEPRGSVDLAEEQRAVLSRVWQAGYAAGVGNAHNAALGFPARYTNPYERSAS